MRRFLWLAGCLFLSTTVPTQAAVVRVFPKLAAVMNADFSPVDPSLVLSNDPYAPVLAPRAEKYLVQIDVLMTIEDLQPGQIGFGNTAFDAEWTSQLSNNQDAPGWAVSPVTVDSNGPLPGGIVPKWADNCDCGAFGADLKGIIIGTAPKSFSTATGENTDPRRTLGIAPYHNVPPEPPHTDGEFAGMMMFDVDGMNPTGSLTLVSLGASTYDADGNLSTDNNTGVGGTLTFGVPEPSTALTLCVGAVAVLLCSRRFIARPHACR